MGASMSHNFIAFHCLLQGQLYFTYNYFIIIGLLDIISNTVPVVRCREKLEYFYAGISFCKVLFRSYEAAS
jgi:hypothetical protein